MRHAAALAVLVVSLAPPARAADPAADAPPKVLLVEWESLKPGTTAAHDKVVAGFAALAGRAKSKGHWIGLNPIAGDENLALFLGGFPSFAAAEAVRKEEEATMSASPALRTEMERLEKAGAALHTSQKAVWTTHQDELSFRAPGAADIGKARYMEVIITRVRPGRIPDYVEFLKAVNQGREKANVPVRLGVFQVASGAPTGTFIIFHPMASLGELDQDSMKSLVSALGEENWKRLRLSYAEIVEENTRTVFAINPKISYPYAAISGADPAFWNPKGKGAAAP
jgi:hypothetical protein